MIFSASWPWTAPPGRYLHIIGIIIVILCTVPVVLIPFSPALKDLIKLVVLTLSNVQGE